MLSGLDLARAECLSDKPWGTVWRATVELPTGPATVVMKVHALKTHKDWVRSSLHLSRLRRQWRGAARLSRAGFGVAKCHALLRGTRDGQRMDVLVMDATPGRTLLNTIADRDLTPAEARGLALGLGRLVNLLWNQKLHSKDLKPSNLLVGPFPAAAKSPPKITILDSDAVGRTPAHPLLPLVIEPFGLGVLPRRTVLWRVAKAWAWNAWLNGPDEFASGAPHDTTGPAGPRAMETRIARRAWRDIEKLVRAHGDATPLHNPIGVGGRGPAGTIEPDDSDLLARSADPG